MIAKDIQQYLASPFGCEFDVDIITPSTAKCFQKLLEPLARLYFVKARYVKKLVSALIADNKLKPFEFVVKRGFKPEAFMHDSGVMSISYGMFIKTSRWVFVSVLCHELSHVWLSQQDYYSELKALNKQFKQQYASVADVELISPIEVYARQVSIAIMEGVLAALTDQWQKDKLLTALGYEREKLIKLENMLSSLQ